MAVNASINASSCGAHGGHNNHSSHSHHDPLEAAHPVFFIFVALALGCYFKGVHSKLFIPYTVLLLVFGVVIGVIGSVYFENSEQAMAYFQVAGMDPHLMLYVFLPPLLFQSSFTMDLHIFRRSLNSVLLLASIGMVFAAFFTGAAFYGIRSAFGDTELGLSACFLLGAILSATDPVAVVALLHELGASEKLAILIEGESLLNDGSAIVLFNVIMEVVGSDCPLEGASVVKKVLLNVIGGPLLGYLFARWSLRWISHVYNSATVEITITISSVYILFYLAELCSISGVLAVVFFGIFMNQGKVAVTTEVLNFLTEFYDMLAFLINTIIFILAGLIMGMKATVDRPIEFVWALLLYVILHIARALSITGLLPYLKRSGYGLGWKEGLVLWWGGLRGSVGLALALVVFGTLGADIDKKQVADLVLLHTATMVIASVVINGATMSALLHWLQLDTLTEEESISLRYAKIALWKSANTKMQALKSDPFMRGAEWTIVRDYAYLNDEDSHLNNNHGKKASAYASNDIPSQIPSPKEDTYEGTVRRFLRLEKRCYWEQYAHGILGRNAVRILSEECDRAIDATPPRYLSFETVAAHMQVPGWYQRFKGVPYFGKRFKKSLFKKLFLAFHIGRGYLVAQKRVQKYAQGTENMRRRSVAASRDGSFRVKSGISSRISSVVSKADSKKEEVLSAVGGRKWNKKRFTMATSVVKGLSTVQAPKALSSDPDQVQYSVGVQPSEALRQARRPTIKSLFANIRKNTVRKIFPDESPRHVARNSNICKNETFLAIILRESKRNQELMLRELHMLQEAWPEIGQAICTTFAAQQIVSHEVDEIKGYVAKGIIQEKEAHLLFHTLEEYQKKIHYNPPFIPAKGMEDTLKELHWAHGKNVPPEVFSFLVENAKEEWFEAGQVVIDPRISERQSAIAQNVANLVKKRNRSSKDEGTSPVSASEEDSRGTIKSALSAFKVVNTAGISRSKSSSVRGAASMIDRLIIISRGVLKVEEMESLVNDKAKSFQIYGPGQVFGEAFLLPLGISTCQKISAETIVRAYTIDLASLRNLLSDYPSVRRALWESFAKTSVSHVLPSMSPYQRMTEPELEMLLADSHMLYFENSDVDGRVLGDSKVGMVIRNKIVIPKSIELTIVVAWGSVRISETKALKKEEKHKLNVRKLFSKRGRMPSLTEMEDMAASGPISLMDLDDDMADTIPEEDVPGDVISMHDFVICTEEIGAFEIVPVEVPAMVCVFVGEISAPTIGFRRRDSSVGLGQGSFKRRRRRRRNSLG